MGGLGGPILNSPYLIINNYFAAQLKYLHATLLIHFQLNSICLS